MTDNIAKGCGGGLGDVVWATILSKPTNVIELDSCFFFCCKILSLMEDFIRIWCV